MSETSIARLIVNRVGTDAIHLALVRHSLADEDGNADPEIITEDVLNCLTGEDLGCLDQEDATPSTIAELYVQQQIDTAIQALQSKLTQAEARIAALETAGKELVARYREAQAADLAAREEPCVANEKLLDGASLQVVDSVEAFAKLLNGGSDA